jgi:O-acetyl-ADP-ribose deacetylase (regulator of RNase III)
MSVYVLSGDLFLSCAQTLAHGCNCRGKMGAGIALEFKRRYPEMFKQYKGMCHRGEFVPGGYFLSKQNQPWVLNLATQDTIGGAKWTYLEQCLQQFTEYYQQEGITSLALPRIAAGLGGLEWDEVRQLMFQLLDPLLIPVFVYETYLPGVKADED